MGTNQKNMNYDIQKAKNLYEKGLCYINGDDCEKDLDVALSYFIQSVWCGNAQAARNVGILLSSDEIKNPDLEEAFWYFLHAAKHGDNVAQLNVGKYFSKMGDFKDLDYPPYNMYTANIWFEKAANAGNIRAAFLYGVHLLEGSGCAQDIQKAIQYFEFGAKKGHVGCMYNLGIIYHGKAFGLFYVDENKAGYWFNMAAQNGDKQAMEMLNMYKYSKLTKRWSQKSN